MGDVTPSFDRSIIGCVGVGGRESDGEDSAGVVAEASLESSKGLS